MLSTNLIRASSIDALLTTNRVTSCGGGVTLFVPGKMELVETRVHLSNSMSLRIRCISTDVIPNLVTLVILYCTSELVIVMNSLDCFIPSIVLFEVLTAPN